MATKPLPLELEADIRDAAQVLPRHYNFELIKTVSRIRQAGATRAALQFPEGLLMFSCVIADLVTRFTGAECVILADVTYGACCIDDLGASSLGCDFLVHYGHSCLVPVDTSSSLKVLYVFVDISFDISHLVACINDNFRGRRIALLGTIQFSSALHGVKQAIGVSGAVDIVVPQAKPLSPGEVLGCTSPRLPPDVDTLVFVADGRFHLEAAMIHNPDVAAFRYDPYSKIMTREEYDVSGMQAFRRAAIDASSSARRFGLILGTLGRQGSVSILKRLEARLTAAGKEFFVLLLSEVTPAKLASCAGVDAWIQVACPRLSIDWGGGFEVPLLTPYEAEVALGATLWREVYPMDYYAKGSQSWTNYWKDPAVAASAR